jgi:hypothetical protein
MENAKILEKGKDILNKIIKVSLFVIFGLLGYSVCEIYHYTKDKIPNIKGVKKMSETSVAVNERGEIMIIDRRTGEYSIYQDSVGRSIFLIYANTITSKYESVK